MASKASLKAYIVLGCCLWLAEEIRKKSEDLQNNAVVLKQSVHTASNMWEDSITPKQLQKIQKFIYEFFVGTDDLVRAGSMFLAALEDIYLHVKPQKKEALKEVITNLSHIIMYFDQGDDWQLYEQGQKNLDYFNKIQEKVIYGR